MLTDCLVVIKTFVNVDSVGTYLGSLQIDEAASANSQKLTNTPLE